MNKFIIWSCFQKEDDFGSDAWGYDLELNGMIITGFGDDYHDKGHYKAMGFIEGYAQAKGWEVKKDYIVEQKEKVDDS